MTDNKFEFMLEDRIAKIRSINEQWDLEHNSYVSDSGGKDSRVNSEILDIALPGNKIPRVYFNTGIEYKEMLEFMKERQKHDSRIIIINSGVNIKKMLEENGYPFKSKQHSHNWSLYNNNNNKELDKTIKYLKDNPNKQFDYNYIHNLPKGIKTIVKYIFGVREKTTKTKFSEKPINKFSRKNDFAYNKNEIYKTEYGIIEKATPNNVVEREREREEYSKIYEYSDLP